jgi:hypothetical protein
MANRFDNLPPGPVVVKITKDYEISGDCKPVSNPLPKPESDYIEQAGERGILGSIFERTWGVLAGDFNENPSMNQIVVRTIITVLPVVDQVADVQDVSAGLYTLVWKKRYNEFEPWLVLVITLIGCIPTVGSVLKGVLKVARKGSKGADLAKVFRKLNWAGKGDGLTWLKGQRTKLSDYGEQVAKRITEILDELTSKLTVLKRYLFDSAIQKVDELLKVIGNVRSLVKSKVDEVMQYLNKNLDELLMQEKRVDLSAGTGKKHGLSFEAEPLDDDILSRPARPVYEGMGKAEYKESTTMYERMKSGKRGKELREKFGVVEGEHIHHSIPHEILDKFPGVFTPQEINLERNLRGIRGELWEYENKCKIEILLQRTRGIQLTERELNHLAGIRNEINLTHSELLALNKKTDGIRFSRQELQQARREAGSLRLQRQKQRKYFQELFKKEDIHVTEGELDHLAGIKELSPSGIEELNSKIMGKKYRPENVEFAKKKAEEFRGSSPSKFHKSKIHEEIWNRKKDEIEKSIKDRGLTPGTPEYNYVVRRQIMDAQEEIDELYGGLYTVETQEMLKQMKRGKGSSQSISGIGATGKEWDDYINKIADWGDEIW